jgi:hypothetical protein
VLWKSVWLPLLLAFGAAGVAAFWPWLQSFHRGRKFQRLIRRELEEIGPYPEEPDPGRPWWEHATKRFIHEEIFRREQISQNRGFILDLDPTVVYEVSQLWIALEKRDGNSWMHFLRRVAVNPRLRSIDLQAACKKWEGIIAAQREDWLTTMGIPTPYRQAATLARVPELFQKRFDTYSELLSLTDFAGIASVGSDGEALSSAADRMTTWYYANGAGLLLSGRAFEQFHQTREILRSSLSEKAVTESLSRLRTALKIDLGVRQPQERDVALAWPEEERW